MFGTIRHNGWLIQCVPGDLLGCFERNRPTVAAKGMLDIAIALRYLNGMVVFPMGVYIVPGPSEKSTTSEQRTSCTIFMHLSIVCPPSPVGGGGGGGRLLRNVKCGLGVGHLTYRWGIFDTEHMQR